MVIVISYPGYIDNEYNTILHLFEGGLETFHLRKKSFTENEMADFIENIPSEHHKKIVLHSHFQLAQGYGLKGIHGSEGSYPAGTASLSFHSFGEITSCGKKFDYAFLGPVFDSISKKGYNSPFNLNELKAFLQGRNEKVIALGGVSEENAGALSEVGFSGIALLGAVWLDPQPALKFKRIAAKWKP